MSKEVLWIWTVETLAGITAAIEEVHREAKARGHHPETVYANYRFTAIEEILTDGSKVMNLHVREYEGSTAG